MRVKGNFLFALSLVAAAPLLWGGSTQEAQAQMATAGAYSIGGFLGYADRRSADFTYGAEFEYIADHPWSYGAIIEHTPDVVANDGATVVLVTGSYRPEPGARTRITGGAGMQLRDYGGDHFRMRLGASYDLFIEGPFRVSPKIALDFFGGTSSLVVGVTASRRF